ncbi:hypothetical protein RUM43_001028 [Polyplax serrata]|uniref:Uncharacterized protein n=1 Tax=Polyplax serrata TaxID=468196 RepID=A0AAN8XPZ8_POLSC
MSYTLNRTLKLWANRNIGRFTVNKFSNGVKPNEPQGEGNSKTVEYMHEPSAFDKRVFVFVGKYKSIDEVPNRVSTDLLSHARSKMRIKVANIMIAGSLLCSLIICIVSKRAAHGNEEEIRKQQESLRAY